MSSVAPVLHWRRRGQSAASIRRPSAAQRPACVNRGGWQSQLVTHGPSAGPDISTRPRLTGRWLLTPSVSARAGLAGRQMNRLRMGVDGDGRRPRLRCIRRYCALEFETPLAVSTCPEPFAGYRTHQVVAAHPHLLPEFWRRTSRILILPCRRPGPQAQLLRLRSETPETGTSPRSQSGSARTRSEPTL